MAFSKSATTAPVATAVTAILALLEATKSTNRNQLSNHNHKRRPENKTCFRCVFWIMVAISARWARRILYKAWLNEQETANGMR